MDYPADWEEVKLLDHVKLIQGLTYTPENVKTHGTLVLRSSNIQNGQLSLNNNVYVNSQISKEKMIQDKDILICVRNGSSELIGKSCVLPSMNNTTFGAFMSVLRGDSTGYIAKIFENDIVQKQIRGRSSATINQITKKDFESIKIPLPPLAEQKAIAETLETFDEHIKNLSELIEKKKAIRDGALEDLMSGRIRLKNFSGDWEIKKLGGEYSIIMGQSPSSSSYNQDKKGLPLIQGNADIKNGITFTERYTSQPTKICEANTTILSVRAPVGTVNQSDQKVCLGRGVCAIIGEISNFIYYLMKYNEKSWKKLEQGSTFTAVSRKVINDFEIFIPKDKTEQQAIAETLTAFDDEIKALEAERDKIKKIRDGAMNDLLTGKVRLKNYGK